MKLALLSLLYSALCAFDVWATVRIVSRHPEGLAVEMNEVIVKLAKRFGIAKGVSIGVGVPAAAILALLVALGWPTGLAFVCGMRTWLSVGQVEILKRLS